MGVHGHVEWGGPVCDGPQGLLDPAGHQRGDPPTRRARGLRYLPRVSPVIQLGDSGHYVRAWQRIAGLFGHAVTSRFDDITDKAVPAWQLARGVEPDGVVGPLALAVVQPGDLIKPYDGCVL